jgi:3-oxoadipate enol-lactonase
MAVLDAADAPRAHACGVSLGGMVALWLAANAPDHIDRVVAANTGATVATPKFWEQRIAAAQAQGLPGIADAVTARWFTDRFRQTDLMIADRFRSMLSECTTQGYVGCCAALRDADLREALGRITAPVLIITGAKDKATPPEVGTFLRHRVSNARGVTLDAAHLSNVEQADDFTAAILTFLTEPN